MGLYGAALATLHTNLAQGSVLIWSSSTTVTLMMASGTVTQIKERAETEARAKLRSRISKGNNCDA